MAELGIAPMSDFNSNALAVLQGDLRINIDMKASLTDMLEEPQGGFMSRAEAMTVRKDASPMERLIEILRGKADAQFDTFCQMLQRSNHESWAKRLKQEAEKFRTNDQKEGYRAVVPLECVVELNDRSYLERVMKKAIINKTLNPCKLIKGLYANTIDRVTDILVQNAMHFNSMVRAARTAIQLELAEGDAKALTTTLTVEDLLEKLCISIRWDDTYLLDKIVWCLPEDARRLAVSLVKRYDLYLDVYNNAVMEKDSLNEPAAASEVTEAQMPVEVTVSKDLSEFTCKDCKDILDLLLRKAWKIPRSMIMVTEARSGDSTTVVFTVNVDFMQNIIQYSVEGRALWAFKELSVTWVRIGRFELNVSQLLTQQFTHALRSGLTGSMDFVGATKALPYQVYALVDLDRTEQLLVQTISHKIARPWPEQGSETQLLHLGVDKGGLTFPVEQQSAHHQCIEKHKQPLKLQDADGSDHLQRQGKPSLLTQLTGKNCPEVDSAVASYVTSYNKLTYGDQTALIAEMLYVLSHQAKNKKRKHSITVGTMTGVIQKTADRDVLEGIVTSYFTDSLQSFVNDFLQLTKDQVYMVEDKIMKQLAAAFEQGRDTLAQQIVTFCENQNTDADTTAAYGVVAEQGNPLDVVKRFLSAKMYAEAPNQTLSESDWELRKATIFLKSVFFHESEEGSITSIMEWAIRDKFAFWFKDAQTGKISQTAVERFISATVTLLRQMLKSESTVIPWIGLETYDPMFVDVDARQLCSLPVADTMSEDDFKGWRIASYKRPILLSCYHQKIKIVKGKVRLDVPQEV